MKTQLIFLSGNTIIVSDEKLKHNDWLLEKRTIINQFPNYLTDLGDCQKIIAGLPSQPRIDFNGLEVEFGVVDVRKLAKISSTLQEGTYTTQHSITYQHGFIDGYNKGLFLNDKKWTDDSVIAFAKHCFYKGFEKSQDDDANCFTAWREEASKLIQSLTKSKTFNVEIQTIECGYSDVVDNVCVGCGTRKPVGIVCKNIAPYIIDGSMRILRKLERYG